MGQAIAAPPRTDSSLWWWASDGPHPPEGHKVQVRNDQTNQPTPDGRRGSDGKDGGQDGGPRRTHTNSFLLGSVFPSPSLPAPSIFSATTTTTTTATTTTICTPSVSPNFLSSSSAIRSTSQGGGACHNHVGKDHHEEEQNDLALPKAISSLGIAPDGVDDTTPPEIAYTSQQSKKQTTVLFRKNRNFQDDFILSDTILGYGLSGAVKVCECRTSGRRYAMKRLPARQLMEDELELTLGMDSSVNKSPSTFPSIDGVIADSVSNTGITALLEVDVHSHLQHPNICKLVYVYKDRFFLYLIMELCAGKELFCRLEAAGRLPESEVRLLTIQMLRAISYLHENSFVHRDLKLENWMYDFDGEGTVDLPPQHFGVPARSSYDEGLRRFNSTTHRALPPSPSHPLPHSSSSSSLLSRLKLIDFGFARHWNAVLSRPMRAACGSTTYISPDALSGCYTNACDMWTIGVMVYLLLAGEPPFTGRDTRVVLQRIKKVSFSLCGWKWEGIDFQTKHFIATLLTKDHTRRLKAAEALRHPWLSPLMTPSPPSALLAQNLVESVQKYRHLSESTPKLAKLLRRAAGIALTEDVPDSVEIFESLDTSHNGLIGVKQWESCLSSCCSEAESQALFYTLAEDGVLQYTDLLVGMSLGWAPRFLASFQQVLNSSDTEFSDRGLECFLSSISTDVSIS